MNYQVYILGHIVGMALLQLLTEMIRIVPHATLCSMNFNESFCSFLLNILNQEFERTCYLKSQTMHSSYVYEIFQRQYSI